MDVRNCSAPKAVRKESGAGDAHARKSVALRKGVLDRGGALLHRREHMRVGVERDGYGGVPQHLREDLGVHVLGQEQGSARVPEVVEAYLRQPRPLFEPDLQYF